ACCPPGWGRRDAAFPGALSHPPGTLSLHHSRKPVATPVSPDSDRSRPTDPPAATPTRSASAGRRRQYSAANHAPPTRMQGTWEEAPRALPPLNRAGIAVPLDEDGRGTRKGPADTGSAGHTRAPKMVSCREELVHRPCPQ